MFVVGLVQVSKLLLKEFTVNVKRGLGLPIFGLERVRPERVVGLILLVLKCLVTSRRHTGLLMRLDQSSLIARGNNLFHDGFLHVLLGLLFSQQFGRTCRKLLLFERLVALHLKLGLLGKGLQVVDDPVGQLHFFLPFGLGLNLHLADWNRERADQRLTQAQKHVVVHLAGQRGAVHFVHW